MLKKNGNDFKARCPSHDDRTPSLSLSEKDGKILYYCHAGCSQDSVMAGLRKLGIGGRPVAEPARQEKPRTIDLSHISKTYERSLSDDMREILSASRMISENVISTFGLGQKDRRISIPIHGENETVEDIRLYLPVPYRGKGDAKVLPDRMTDASPRLFPMQLLRSKLVKPKDGIEIPENVENLENLGPTSDFSFVILCEGEMDALALISAGYFALTNTCGAKTWKESFTEAISSLGRPVVIIMDNDSAGETGALLRAQSLTNAGVRVSIVNWPKERSEGHDVTDELKMFGKASLDLILGKAELFSDIIYLNEVVAESINWLFSPFIARQKTTIVEGEPGIGKSFLMLAIAGITSIGGKNPLNSETFPSGKVLLMSAEDGLADTIRPRLEQMESDLTKIFAPKEIFTLDEKGFETLEKLISREQPILVIIDPLMPFLASGADSNKATDMRPFFKGLAKLAEKHDCAIVVTRHLAKCTEKTGVSRGLGSIDISAAVRSILQVTSDPESKNLKLVTHIKSNLGAKGKTFGYRLDNGEFSWIPEVEQSGEPDDDSHKEIERACAFLTEALSEGPLEAQTIHAQAKEIGISKTTLNRAKKKVSIHSRQVKEGGKLKCWEWYLPGCQDSPPTQDFHTPSRGSYFDPESYKED